MLKVTGNISNETYNELFNAMKHNPSLVKNVSKQIANFLKSKAEQSQYNYDYSSEEEALSRMNKDTLALYVLFYLKYSDATVEEKEKIKNTMVQNSMKNLKVASEEYDEDLIVKRIRKEAEEKAKEIYNEDDLGFEDEVVEEMQKRLGELGIDWSPYIETEE